MMGNPGKHTALEPMRKLIHSPSSGGVSDGQLLDRITRRRDEAAFELLVWRHGPMVLGLCQRMIADEHLAEDAFQATFLTLVRKAKSIGKKESVCSWLYKVAYRISIRAGTNQSRLAVREQPLTGHAELEMAADRQVSPAHPPDAMWNEIRPLLDDEVHRLPEKCRTAFILCCLQGKTNQEAADELGCPKGTILSRLSRARERLRIRLAYRLRGRGIDLEADPLADLLASHAVAANALPSSLACSTALLAAASLAGGSMGPAIPNAVLELARGALRHMVTRRLKLAGALLALFVACSAVIASARPLLALGHARDSSVLPLAPPWNGTATPSQSPGSAATNASGQDAPPDFRMDPARHMRCATCPMNALFSWGTEE